RDALRSTRVPRSAPAPPPLMQEQSMFLDGCTVNPWPLDSELWTTFEGALL
ncbi:putative lipo protein, partial [Bifidobacterium animalis subsp. animalis]